MFFRRFYDDQLAQASYLIGCQATGEALVVDPNRHLEPYLRGAEAEGLRITHVTETHIHADFVSGARELAHRTGARLLLSDEGGDDWRYRYAAEAGAQLLHDGDTFCVGHLAVRVVHTPGPHAGARHLPGHRWRRGDRAHGRSHRRLRLRRRRGPSRPARARGAASPARWRPGRGSSSSPSNVSVAFRTTCRSGPVTAPAPRAASRSARCRRPRWATSGASTGRSASRARTSSCVRCSPGQPEPPRYFAEMKRINRDGPRLRDHAERPPRVGVAELAAGACRGHAGGRHAPGARVRRGERSRARSTFRRTASFATWSGSLLPYDRDFYLIAEDHGANGAGDLLRALAGIGLDRVAGTAGSNALDAWQAAGRSIETISAIAMDEVASALATGDVGVLDVRSRSEWAAGHLPGAANIPLGELEDRIGELPRQRPLVVQCQTGSRAAIAASLLRARGVTGVRLYGGGFAEWSAAGKSVERPGSRLPPAQGPAMPPPGRCVMPLRDRGAR